MHCSCFSMYVLIMDFFDISWYFLNGWFWFRHWDVKVYKLCCLKYTNLKFLILVGVIMGLRGKPNENNFMNWKPWQILCKILLNVSKNMLYGVQGFYCGNFVLLRVMFREQAGKTDTIQCRLLLKSYNSRTSHSSNRMREHECIITCLFWT